MPRTPEGVTARRADESLSQWHERHRPVGKEVAWLQITVLHLLASFAGVARGSPSRGGLLLGSPGILFGLGRRRQLEPVDAGSGDPRGPVVRPGAVRLGAGRLALGVLGAGDPFLPCLGRFGEVVLFVRVLVWPPRLFVIARP